MKSRISSSLFFTSSFCPRDGNWQSWWIYLRFGLLPVAGLLFKYRLRREVGCITLDAIYNEESLSFSAIATTRTLAFYWFGIIIYERLDIVNTFFIFDNLPPCLVVPSKSPLLPALSLLTPPLSPFISLWDILYYYD